MCPQLLQRLLLLVQLLLNPSDIGVLHWEELGWSEEEGEGGERVYIHTQHMVLVVSYCNPLPWQHVFQP